MHIHDGDLAGIVCRDHFYFIAVPLDEVLMHCGGDTTVGMNPDPSKQHRVCTLAVNDEERCRCSLAAHCQFHIKNPIASDGCPLKSLSITLVFIRSAEERPNRRSTEYGIKLTAAPVSTNILFTGLPLMKPLRYNPFKCL